MPSKNEIHLSSDNKRKKNAFAGANLTALADVDFIYGLLTLFSFLTSKMNGKI